jgi:sugar lactone lactonase YvrE
MKSNQLSLAIPLIVLVTVLLVFLAFLVPASGAPKPPLPEGKVLVKGSPIHMANGLMFDRYDRLYIASVCGREIIVMDPNTGKILDRIGTDKGVEGPDDLCFGPDGSLYWTSILTGEVSRLSPDGVKTGQFLAPGVNPITFSDDGRLFVALDFLGDGLYELDPNLVNPPRLVIPPPLGFLNGMDFGPDGLLYGPIWTQGRVVKIDVDTGAITTVATGCGTPAAVKFDSRGRLHVLDALRGQVIRVDIETGAKELIATLDPGLDNLAFDSRDRLFVSHSNDGTIFHVFPNGQAQIISRGGMILPGGVAVLSRSHGRESVLVADLFTLREFDGRTGRPISLVRHVIGTPGVTEPYTVSRDGSNMVLSSVFDNAVQVWNPETQVALETYHDFAVPLNAIRFLGDLVVAELGTAPGAARIVRATSAGRITLADAADGIVVPAGLAATRDDLWVSDWATGKVWLVVANGTPLSNLTLVVEGLSNPEGLAIDLDGSMLVVEAGAGRLSRIDLATGNVSIVAEGLALGAPGVSTLPPTNMFNGVAVGPSGAIYVTGDRANVLYRFRADH